MPKLALAKIEPSRTVRETYEGLIEEELSGLALTELQ